jgi:hypothetical protein
MPISKLLGILISFWYLFMDGRRIPREAKKPKGVVVITKPIAEALG